MELWMWMIGIDMNWYGNIFIFYLVIDYRVDL